MDEATADFSVKTIGKKIYQLAPALDELAKDIIVTEGLDIREASIRYMLVYPNISPLVAGRCIRCAKELKYFGECDYIIQMSGDLWETLDDDTQKVLMHHELLHVFVGTDRKGDPKFSLVNHDVQDFSDLIRRYGIVWLYTLRTKSVDLNEKIDPKRVRL